MYGVIQVHDVLLSPLRGPLVYCAGDGYTGVHVQLEVGFKSFQTVFGCPPTLMQQVVSFSVNDECLSLSVFAFSFMAVMQLM